ncbi:MAG: hypothetical protein E6Q87_02895, partial [Cellvibrionales bacterium]
MKNRAVFVILLLVAALAGCRDEAAKFFGRAPLRWAIVDRSSLESEYILLAKQKNADLLKQKFGEGVSRDQMRALEEEMNSARMLAERDCMKPEFRANLESNMDSYCHRYRGSMCASNYDMKCIATIDGIPEVMAVKTKINTAKEVANYQRKIEQAIRAKTKSAIGIAISSYAKETAIDLVINDGKDDILFA